MANVLVLLAGLLVVTRVTRLLTIDRVFQPARDWVVDRKGVGSALTYFVHCPWCVGLWLSVVAAVGVWFTAPDGWPITAWWGVPGIAAAYAWACGAVAVTTGGGE